MRPDLSIVIPAFDEAARLEVPLGHIFKYLEDQKINGEIIVVDDGSSDDTSAVADAVTKRQPKVMSQVVRYEPNRGKGYAVREGLKAASADIALFTDADLSTPIEELPKLVEPIRRDEIDVAFGSRRLTAH